MTLFPLPKISSLKKRLWQKQVKVWGWRVLGAAGGREVRLGRTWQELLYT